MPIVNMGAATLPEELKMKTNSRFHRVVAFAFAAVFAAVSAQAVTYTWNAGSGAWSTPENWLPNGTPGVGDDVVLPAPAEVAGNYVVTADAAINVKSLTVGTDDAADGCTATFESQTAAMHRVAENVVVKKGGVLTHTAAAANALYKLYLRCGNMTVDAYGAVNVDNKGGTVISGGNGGYRGGSYGGRGVRPEYGVICYGSIREPDDYGSVGSAGNGGGVVRLEVSGTLRVNENGSISAGAKRTRTGAYGNGSGGSLWLTVGTLSGGGTIDVVPEVISGYFGGGGRIAIKQTDVSTRTAFTGKINVSNGTLYREDAGDEPGRGELIFQGGKDQISELSAAVVDATVGFKKITFEGTGMTLIVMDDICIPVYGDIVAAGNEIRSDVTTIYENVKTKGGIMGGFDIIGESGQVTHISGTFTVGKLICTNESSTIEFAAGTAITLRDAALLRMSGTEQSPLVMTAPEPSWNLVLGNDVDAQVKYVAVSNSVAFSTITDFGGTDLGGNVKWTFPPMPKLGDPITWKGTAGSSWLLAENWVDKDGGNRLPIETDCVVISNGCPAYPTLSLASAAFHQLRIGPGAELTIANTQVSVVGDLVCDGKIVLSGTASLSVAGDVTLAADSLTAGLESVFALAGEGEQTADLGGNAFNRLEVLGPSVTFTNGFSTTFFRCEQPREVTLRFSAGDTYAASDLRMLPGAGGSLTLRSTQEGESWFLNAGAGAVCDGVSVADCDARVGCAICVTSNTDITRTYNWRTGATEWTGAAGTNWDDPENWSGGVPTSTSDVRIFPTANAPKLSSATSIRSLVVGNGSGDNITLALSGTLAVSDFLRVNDGATMVIDKPLSVTNDVYLASGATLTHTAGTDANPYKLNLYCGRDMVVENGAVITADNLGGSKKGGGSGGWGQGGSYGGRGSTLVRGKPCYGSIREPNDLGSTGAIGNGGGAIRLEVVRTLRMDGTISADATMTRAGIYGTGSGGSVWLTVGTLVGKGPISVITMNSTQLGGGGRVAIRQTVASTRTAFTGPISVSNGTLYREDAGDEPGRGELIFQGGKDRTAELSAAVVDAAVGFKKITFEGTGMTLIVMDDVRVPVYGDVIAAGNTIKSDVTTIWDEKTRTENCKTTGGIMGGFDIVGASGQVTQVSGTFTVGQLICTNEATAIEFAKGTSITLRDSALLRLSGTEKSPLVMMSAEPSWNLVFGDNVDAMVKYVAASNSVASSTVADMDGTDLGGNANWTFPVLPKLGDPIVWRGTAGSSWSVAENWVDKDGGNRLPIETDCVVISNGCPAYPTLSVASAAYHQLRIGPGAELTIVDTPITIASDLVCEGKLVLSGTTVLSAAGDVTLAAGSLAAGAASAFTLTGEDEQSADLGGNAFNRITVTGPSVTFAHGFSTTFFRCEQPRAVELRFSKGDTYAASDLRMLPGAGGSLTLRSTQEGESWYLNAGAGAVCDGVSVADCDARVGCAICVTSYNDLGRNHNWRSGTTAWTGAKGTAWEDPENWSDGAPISSSDVRIFPAANAPKLSSASSIRSLVVGGGSGDVTLALSGALAVSDFLRVNDGATVVVDAPLSVTNDVYLASGAKLTHTAGTDKNPYKLNLYCGRDMVVEEGAVITADDLGGSTKGGGNGHWGQGGSYGGRGSTLERGKPCYGSIREPNDLGSTGAIGNGGGAIRLEVVGTLRMDGTISADATMTKAGVYGTGSGGSVWLTVGTLVGNGPISVITKNNGQLGGGGRVAIRQTVASTRTAFTGQISVSNGTLYREDADDELGRGELIFQSGGIMLSELSKDVVDATNGFKKITFTGTGMTLIVMDDIRVPVYGDVVAAENTVKSDVTTVVKPDYSEGGTTTTGGIMGGFDILGSEDGTTHLSGTFRLGTFICTNGAEALEFAAGTTMTNYSNGTLWLTGTDRRKTVLRSSELGSPWFISVGTNVAGKVRCLDVYDSDASGGQTIKAKRSTGRKGRNNVNWEFPAGFALIIR